MAKWKPNPDARIYKIRCAEKGFKAGTKAFDSCIRHEAFHIQAQTNKQLNASMERDKKICAARGLVERGTKAQKLQFRDCMDQLTDSYIRRVEVQRNRR